MRIKVDEAAGQTKEKRVVCVALRIRFFSVVTRPTTATGFVYSLYSLTKVSIRKEDIVFLKLLAPLYMWSESVISHQSKVFVYPVATPC